MRHWVLILALVWTSKLCFTPGHVIQFLNTLPPPRAAEAKVVDNKDAFTVFYRVERDLPVAGEETK